MHSEPFFFSGNNWTDFSLNVMLHWTIFSMLFNNKDLEQEETVKRTRQSTRKFPFKQNWSPLLLDHVMCKVPNIKSNMLLKMIFNDCSAK